MLKPAIQYKEELQKALKKAYHNDKERYSYYDPIATYKFFLDGENIQSNTMKKHQFVSVYKDKIVGFISYNINLQDYRVYNLRIISFANSSMTFGVDLKRLIENIFELYKFRKLNVEVFVGNPIESSYDKIFAKIGGRIVGVYKEHCRLADGKFHDYKLYEILRKDYLKARGKSK